VKLPTTLLPVAIGLLALAGCGSSTTKTVVINEPATTVTTPYTSTTPAATTTASTGGTLTLTAPVTTPRTTTTAATNPTQHPSASTTVHLTSFRSPTGNIGCVMLDGTARCDISHRSWAPPSRPASCPQEVDFGQGLIVGRTGAGGFVCAGDTALDPTGTALHYGTASVEGTFTCVSATSGVTCTNGADGHGFFISRQSYRLF
jgi:hypothetical protein